MRKDLRYRKGSSSVISMTTATPLPTKVITLDMDGSCFDPWACCGRKDHTYVGTKDCRHLRTDTLRKIREIWKTHPTAKLVVLSWRSGMEQVTREWLGHVGIFVTHVFIPGTADTLAIGVEHGSQVSFKVNVAKALQARGVEIVGGFEDNPDVVAALQAVGANTTRVEHLVEVHGGKVGGRPEGDWYNREAVTDSYVEPAWGDLNPVLPDWDACNRLPFLCADLVRGA